MLLREFKVGEYTIMLIQEEDTYIAQVLGAKGEKAFYHEYNDYDKIKSYFDEIIHNFQQDNDDIEYILDILKKSML